MKKKYKMLGKVYQINTIDSFEGELLHKELQLYPAADNNANVDVVVNYLNKLEDKNPVLRNPSSHSHYNQGFRLELINSSIEFHFTKKKLIQIDFCIKQGNAIMANVNKWLSYQFTNRKESIGSIFHELILIPSAFFFSDLTVVHASAINNGGAVLFGGTGGVGKTSLEMELCANLNLGFFADDIVVVNNKGFAFPNLSYPKIYGYNLINNDEIRKKIFSNADVFDKIHWHSRKSINPAIVRRRVNPVDLYKNVTQQSIKLKTFYILIKDGSTKTINVSKISIEEASKLNRLVLETEYHVFYKHLLWDEFNSTIAANEIKLSYSELMNRIELNFRQALTNINTFLVKIPININHKDLLEQLPKIVNK